MMASPMNFWRVPFSLEHRADHFQKVFVELLDELLGIGALGHAGEAADIAEQDGAGLFAAAEGFLEGAFVIENRFGNTFGDVTVEDVAVAATLELLKHVLKNNAERAGANEAKERRHHGNNHVGLAESKLADNEKTYDGDKKKQRLESGVMHKKADHQRDQHHAGSAKQIKQTRRIFQRRVFIWAYYIMLAADWSRCNMGRTACHANIMDNFGNGADDDDFILKGGCAIKRRIVPKAIHEQSLDGNGAIQARRAVIINEIVMVIRWEAHTAPVYFDGASTEGNEIIGILIQEFLHFLVIAFAHE